MTDYVRSAEDRRNAIINDTNAKFYFESQKFSDVPNYQNLLVQNYIDVNPFGIAAYFLAQRNDWGAQVVRQFSGMIESASARYSIDPDIVKAIIYTEVSRGFYGYFAESLGLANTIFPGNINASWSVLVPGRELPASAPTRRCSARRR